MPIELELPWPPTVNRYWRHTRQGRVYIGKPGLAFRKEVIKRLSGITPIRGAIYLEVMLCKPTMTKGTAKQAPRAYGGDLDLDNALKAILDSLQHGGAYRNDRQIDVLLIYRGLPCADGKAVVTLKEIDPPCQD